MNILMLGSDQSLIGEQALGDAVERHALYGQFVEHLDIIVYSRQTAKLQTFVIASNVMGHPSNSVSKMSYWFDALKIIKNITASRKTDVVVCQDPFLFGLLGVYLKRKLKCKLQISFHGDFWHNPAWRRESKFSWLWEMISHFTVARADAIRVVSSGIGEKVTAAGISRDKVFVIPTPVQKPGAEGTTRHYDAKNNYLVFDGRLVTTKNIFFMLDVFVQVKAKYPDLKLWLIGDGPLRQQISDYIKTHNLQADVILLGLLPHSQLGLYFQKSSAQLLFSTHESFGKVIIEAGLWQCPTIATATTGSESIIVPQKTGLIIRQNDAAAAIEAIISLLENKSLGDSLGREAEHNYSQRFDRQAVVAKIINLWKRLAQA